MYLVQQVNVAYFDSQSLPFFLVPSHASSQTASSNTPVRRRGKNGLADHKFWVFKTWNCILGLLFTWVSTIFLQLSVDAGNRTRFCSRPAAVRVGFPASVLMGQ